MEPAQLPWPTAANIAVERMPEALAARERGVPLVNIGQVFARSGMQLVCRADSGIARPPTSAAGGWASGGRRPLRGCAWLAGHGLAPGDVTMVDQDHDAALLLEAGPTASPP